MFQLRPKPEVPGCSYQQQESKPEAEHIGGGVGYIPLMAKRFLKRAVMVQRHSCWDHNRICGILLHLFGSCVRKVSKPGYLLPWQTNSPSSACAFCGSSVNSTTPTTPQASAQVPIVLVPLDCVLGHKESPVHVHIHMQIHIYIYIHMHAPIHMRIHVHTHIRVYIDTQINVCYVYMYTHFCIQMHIIARCGMHTIYADR